MSEIRSENALLFISRNRTELARQRHLYSNDLEDYICPSISLLIFSILLQPSFISSIYLPPGHNSSDTCFFPIGFHVNMPSGKMGYVITETKFDRNFPLVDSRNIEESFSF